MKKKMQILVPALAVLTLAAGCRSQQNAENDNQVQVVVTSEPIFVPHRKISPADSILGEYLIVRDNRWHLTITLDEAVALGADRKAFRKNIKLVEEQNKDIERCEKEGVEIIFYPPNIEWLRKKDRSFTIPRQSTVEDLKKLFVIDDDGNRIPVWPDETEEDAPPVEKEQNDDPLEPEAYAQAQILSRSMGSFMSQTRLAGGTLRDMISNRFSFRGPPHIEISGGSTAPVWSIGFNENSMGIHTSLRGFIVQPTQSQNVSAPLATPPITYWNWDVTKHSGDNSIATAAFHTQPYDAFDFDDGNIPLPVGIRLRTQPPSDVIVNNTTGGTIRFRFKSVYGVESAEFTLDSGGQRQITGFTPRTPYMMTIHTSNGWGDYVVDFVYPVF